MSAAQDFDADVIVVGAGPVGLTISNTLGQYGVKVLLLEKGEELIDVIPAADLAPQSEARLVVTRADGSRQETTLTLRIDTPIEVDYFTSGGILPYVLRQLLA